MRLISHFQGVSVNGHLIARGDLLELVYRRIPEYDVVEGSSMIHFRTLDRGDLPLMHRWLNTPHVAVWWPDEALTLDQIIAKYAPRIDGKEDVRCFVIVHGDAPIGYLQEYPIGEDSDYAAHV